MKKIILLIGLLFSLKCYSQTADSLVILRSDTQSYQGRNIINKAFILIYTDKIVIHSPNNEDPSTQYAIYTIKDVSDYPNISYTIVNGNTITMYADDIDLYFADNNNHVYFIGLKYLGKIPVDKNLIANIEAVP